MNYVIFDIETTLTCFLIVMKDFQSKKKVCYKISKYRNDYDAFVRHWKSLVKRDYYFVGFNSLSFDSQVVEFILQKPRTYSEIYNEAQRVINIPDSEKFKQLLPEWKISFNQLDVFKILHYDNKNKSCSLKHAEFSMRMSNIEEMPLPHDISYTEEEELLTEEYCEWDVDATELLFSKILDMVDLRFTIKNDMNINCLNYNNGKIGMEILMKEYCNQSEQYPQDVKKKIKKYSQSIALKHLIYPFIKFKTKEFNWVIDKFKTVTWTKVGEEKDKKSKDKGLFTLNYKQSRGKSAYIYGYGGLHQCCSPGVYTADSEHIIMDADVSALYPSVVIAYYLYLKETMTDEEIVEFLSQPNKPTIFPPHLGLEILLTYKEKIVDKRLREKAKPKDQQNKTIVTGYKEAANIPYGKSGEETSWFYSKEYNLTTTINGQLLISMLTEDLYEIPNIIMLQNNTDGITVKFEKKYLDLYYEKCKNFEKATYLTLEYAEYSKMVINNVNNYLAVYTNGKVKRKGDMFEIYEDFVTTKSFHKNPSFLVIPLALQEYFVNGVDYREFIKNHKNIYDFCAVTKKKSDFELYWYDKKGNKHDCGKITRYIINKDGSYLIKDYGYVENKKTGKKELKTTKVEANHGCQVLNKITDENALNYEIDYSFYIKKVEEIIFSIEGNNKQTTLF